MRSRFLGSNQRNSSGCGPTNNLRFCVSELGSEPATHTVCPLQSGGWDILDVASYKAKASDMQACISLNTRSFTEGINIRKNNFKLL